jgi:hypothetical protein
VQSAQSSLRVSIVRQIRAHRGRMAQAALNVEYNDATLIRMRLQRLTQSGAVVARDGRYYVASASTLVLARFFLWMKLFAFGQSSEFERGRAR